MEEGVCVSKKEVRCAVLAQGGGPKCEDCHQSMDAIRVVSKGHKLYGKQAYYCFHCTLEERRV